MNIVIKIEHLFKEYRLGIIGRGTLYRDLQSYWAKLRNKEDPNSIVGREDLSSENNGRTFLALKNINFEINKGEILGIIGPNGAGKSTLLKILSRITSPSKGSIKIKGSISSLLEVGTGFHSELTGIENIYLNGTMNGMRKKDIELKIKDILEFAGITKFANTPVKRYSSGMFVRLGFAVAAFLDSDILVVDEVLAVGDADFQSKAISKMDEVTKKQQKTVIFVSHNMDSIKKLCSRVMIMKEGKVHDFGETNEMIKKYLSKNNNILKTMGIKKFDKNNAPGGSIIKLDFISTKNTKGEIRHDFKVSDEVVVEFGFYVKDENHQICSNLIFSKDGVSIFETMDNYVKNK